MSDAIELLNGLTDEETSEYLAGTPTERHVVIGQDRFITVPDELKRVAVQFDHNVETVVFDCPRYWDGLDMSHMKVYINYRRNDGVVGCYVADNVVADGSDPDIMHFEWTLTSRVTEVEGELSFLVCIRRMEADGSEKNHWNSELCEDMYISEGLECDCENPEEHPDYDRDLPKPEKIARFYDYDGTLLYSYTAAELAVMEELPRVPKHRGLVTQGWNYTLETLKTYTTPVVVGATYITDDGKTRLYIRISSTDNATIPLWFTQSFAYGVTVDWGDGSNTEKHEGTVYNGGLSNVAIEHTYSNIGTYVITLIPTGGSVLQFGSTMGTSYGIMGSYNDDRLTAKRSCLYKVEIGAGMNVIQYRAFSNCYALETITVPNGVMAFLEGSFSDCRSLKSVVAPGGCSVNFPNTFAKCYSLETVSLPHGWHPNESCFESCYQLKNVTLSNTATAVGYRAFAYCESLEEIVLPESVMSLGSYCFHYCRSLKSVTLSETLTAIPDYAFEYCESLREIVIPGSVATIMDYAFRYCSNLASVHILNGVTKIEMMAFSNCHSLSSVYIPSSVMTLESAFYSCSSLRMVRFTSHEAVPTLTYGSDFPYYEDLVIEVPAALYDEWIAAQYWTEYASRDMIVAV